MTEAPAGPEAVGEERVSSPAEAKLGRLRYLRQLWEAALESFDPFVVLGYEPEPAQAEFHEAAEFDVGYGGRAGGGKTKALLLEAVRWCAKVPRFRAVGFRRTYSEIQESFGKELAAIDWARALGAVYVKGPPPSLLFPNGAVIDFRYAENVQDASRVVGGALQLAMIDERQLIGPDVVQLIRTRIRSEHGVPVVGIRSTFNPGDVGHAYLKARYVDATGMGARVYPEVVDGKPTGVHVRFIPAPPTKHLPSEYWSQTLAGIEDPWLRRALQTGDWDVVPGSAFGEWRRDVHVVDPADMPVEAGTLVGRGVDYGLAAPFCCLWGAKLGDGLVFVYRELYRAELTPAQQAELILGSEEGWESKCRGTWLDPSCWARQPGSTQRASSPAPPPRSIAADYEQAGVRVVRANNDRVGGARLVHDHLRVRVDGAPRLVVSSACENLIRTLPALPRSKVNPEDVDTKAEDHAYDALRYLLAGLVGVARPARSNAAQVRRARIPSLTGRI